MDIVYIKGLKTDAVIGVYDWERNIRQTLNIVKATLRVGFKREPAQAAAQVHLGLPGLAFSYPHSTGVPVNLAPQYLADGTTPVVAGTAITAAQAATLVFTPAANFNGTVTIPFTVTVSRAIPLAISLALAFSVTIAGPVAFLIAEREQCVVQLGFESIPIRWLFFLSLCRQAEAQSDRQQGQR